MAAFLCENLGTVFVGGILAGIVAAIAVKLVRDRQKGMCACGCAGCSNRPDCGEKKI